MMTGEGYSEFQIFLLAAVGRFNLANVTALQKATGISIGASLPALKGLEKAGLVEGRAGERRKRDYQLTPEGEKILSEYWQKALPIQPTDVYAILRAYPLALAMGDRPAAPAAYLRYAARHARHLATRNQPEIDWLRAQLAKLTALPQFRWMRLVFEQRRLEAQAAALEEIADILETEGGSGEGR